MARAQRIQRVLNVLDDRLLGVAEHDHEGSSRAQNCILYRQQLLRGQLVASIASRGIDASTVLRKKNSAIPSSNRSVLRIQMIAGITTRAGSASTVLDNIPRSPHPINACTENAW